MASPENVRVKFVGLDECNIRVERGPEMRYLGEAAAIRECVRRGLYRSGGTARGHVMDNPHVMLT